MSGEASPESAEPRTIWLSGAVSMFLNKLVAPMVYLGLLVGVPAWAYLTVGPIKVKPGFEYLVWFVAIVTVPLAWYWMHLQMVGYRGRELVVANYWREARVPFEAIAAVERAGWYRGRKRLVRVRFNRRTPFGSVVYYVPKWTVFGLFRAPEKELQSVIEMSLIQ